MQGTVISDSGGNAFQSEPGSGTGGLRSIIKFSH